MENKTVEVVEEEKENVVSGATQERVQVGQKICPKCGKPFKPSGLAGHLRFVHGFESARATKATLTAKLDKATVFDVVFEVIEKIEKVRDRKESLKAKDMSNFFETDEAIQEALLALEEQERRLLEELRRLRGEKKEKTRTALEVLSGSPASFLFEEEEDKKEEKEEDKNGEKKQNKKKSIFDLSSIFEDEKQDKKDKKQKTIFDVREEELRKKGKTNGKP